MGSIHGAADGGDVVSAKNWTLESGIAMCRAVERICPEFGCHVALTGGTLYKDGTRKDVDILFYRIRQVPEINVDGLFAALETIGLVKTGGFGWCHKAEYYGRPVDCFFPESSMGDYEQTDPDDLMFPEHTP